jgi:hypothetical protein
MHPRTHELLEYLDQQRTALRAKYAWIAFAGAHKRAIRNRFANVSASDGGRPIVVLRLVFTVHATLTVAAGIVLVIAPAAIPNAVGIIVTPPAFLLCYLLAAAELCIGLISWGARKLTDTHAIRLIATSFIVFHGASALLEIRAFMAGVSSAIWANVVVRFVAVVVFSYYALVRPEGAAVNTSE